MLNLITLISPPAEDHVSYIPPKYTDFTTTKIDAIAIDPKCAPNILVTLNLSCYWYPNINPTLVSSSLSGPKIEWYIPPSPSIADDMMCVIPTIKNECMSVICPPGPTPNANVVKWGSSMNPCSYSGFSST